MNGITSSGAKGINALGPRYMGKYHPLMKIGPRYLLIQGTHRELTEGNGPPFALDVAPMLVLFAIVMTFCILGCFLPSMPLLLICVPIFVPIAKVFGWDLIWFGVIITVLDNMASITPPFGISLFVMKEVAGVTLGTMYRSAVPFVIALFVCLLLIVLFPPLATYLPTLMNG
ncbi:TRAP transporter large permease subunit [Bilophila wadsworthia]|jgi:TRAP-type C4-dicarboxylate transport system permease large subunit|uniref:TRAP transporter large permease subunit n=1 Tax=Bilophila wadsworthia TaxID=35833 RepID=UPI001D37C621|nr:TRAP transporter large permease subunit [Bilophila wadsworthia]MBS5375548.1 TRAP transporter large permease subunit [Bilophila wadsworthia]